MSTGALAARIGVVVLALTGCGTGGEAAQSAQPTRQVTVSAAASLGTAFAKLGRQFEEEHPDVRLTFNHGPSSGLAEQIVRGAPVDVFASADAETMRRVTAADQGAGRPRTFARNLLQIGVPRDNPGRVRTLEDLARPELVVAVCDPQVPCGRAAAQALAVAGVTAKADTFEQDAQSITTKVRLGEVDAALVYRTDVRAAAPDVKGIDFPEAEQAINDYLIVAVKGSRVGAAAQAFIDYVLSPVGQRALTDAGFRTP